MSDTTTTPHTVPLVGDGTSSGADSDSPIAGDYALRESLAKHFAPKFVVRKPISTPEKGHVEQDYHPVDIRFILRSVSSDIMVLGGWLEAVVVLPRSLPKHYLILSSLLSLLWMVLQVTYEIPNPPREATPAWVGWAFLILLFVILMFVLAGASWTVTTLSWPWWPFTLLNAAAFVIAIVATGIRDDGSMVLLGLDWVALFPSVVLTLIFLVQVSLWRRADPNDLLKQIDGFVRPGDMTQRISLRFRNAGPPANETSHRRRYHELRRENEREALGDASKRYLPTAYARIVPGDSQNPKLLAIQYWLAYYYNDWANKHEMDWEQVSLYFSVADEAGSVPHPDQITLFAAGLSQHTGGLAVSLTGLAGTHPQVFVALGSHANYPRPGHYRPAQMIGGLRFTGKDLAILGRSAEEYIDHALPLSEDKTVELSEAAGTLRIVALPGDPAADDKWKDMCKDGRCEPDGRGICLRDFRWLNMRGYWGSQGRLFAGDDAPRSPPQQDSWKDPFFWLEECVRFETPYGRKLLDGKGIVSDP